MKNFSYIHIEKLKVWGRGTLGEKQYKPNKYKRHWGVQGCWEHDLRLIDTPNADPAKLTLNGISCLESKWEIVSAKPENLNALGASSPTFIADKAQNYIQEKNIKVREDQVKVVMLLCAASPEFLRDGDNQNPINNKKVLTWAKTTISFLQATYQDRLLACIIHRDELNPHLTAYVVPALQLDLKKRGPKKGPPSSRLQWTLNASKIFTPDPSVILTLPNGKIQKVKKGKGSCSLLQDYYAEALQAAGLDIRRGVRRAPHQTGLPHENTKDRWEALSSPIPEIDDIPDNQLRSWATKIALQAASSRRFLLEKSHYQEAAAAGALQLKKAIELLKKLKKQKNTLKQALLKPTSCPSTEEVLTKLTGLDTTSSPNGRFLLLPSGLQLLLRPDNTFRNLTPQIPGAGILQNDEEGHTALEAITFITGWSPVDALSWVNHTFGSHAASLMSPTSPLALDLTYKTNLLQDVSKNEETTWPRLFNALTQTFRFDPLFIQQLKETRWIGSNKFGHLTFGKVQFGTGEKTTAAGKFVQDITNPQGFSCETGPDGAAFISAASQTPPKTSNTIIATSPLEAIALKHLHPNNTIILVGQNPREETNKIIERRSTGILSIAEPSTPAQPTLSRWIEELKLKSLKLLKIPLGSTSFLDNYLLPQKKETITLTPRPE